MQTCRQLIPKSLGGSFNPLCSVPSHCEFHALPNSCPQSWFGLAKMWWWMVSGRCTTSHPAQSWLFFLRTVAMISCCKRRPYNVTRNFKGDATRNFQRGMQPETFKGGTASAGQSWFLFCFHGMSITSAAFCQGSSGGCTRFTSPSPCQFQGIFGSEPLLPGSGPGLQLVLQALSSGTLSAPFAR